MVRSVEKSTLLSPTCKAADGLGELMPTRPVWAHANVMSNTQNAEMIIRFVAPLDFIFRHSKV
jgi:hypothetical protein